MSKDSMKSHFKRETKSVCSAYFSHTDVYYAECPNTLKQAVAKTTKPEGALCLCAYKDLPKHRISDFKLHVLTTRPRCLPDIHGYLSEIILLIPFAFCQFQNTLFQCLRRVTIYYKARVPHQVVEVTPAMILGRIYTALLIWRKLFKVKLISQRIWVRIWDYQTFRIQTFILFKLSIRILEIAYQWIASDLKYWGFLRSSNLIQLLPESCQMLGRFSFERNWHVIRTESCQMLDWVPAMIGLELVSKNFRPVSNLSCISKNAEKVVIPQVLGHCCKHAHLPSNQSITSLRLLYLKFITISFSVWKGRKITLLVLLDLSAAFDNIDPSIVTDLLESDFGNCDLVLSWITSFMCWRKRSVTIKQEHSRDSSLLSGVPQGSCLGPLLFIMQASRRFHAKVRRRHASLSFIPAESPYVFTLYEDQAAVRAMEECITDHVCTWMSHNMLILVVGATRKCLRINWRARWPNVANRILKPLSMTELRGGQQLMLEWPSRGVPNRRTGGTSSLP